MLNQSWREHEDLRIFLKQKTNQHIFASRAEETDTENLLKPRSTSFKLYSRNDVELMEVKKHFIAPQKPQTPNTETLNEAERMEAKRQFSQDKQIYVDSLNPPKFDLNMPQFAEAVNPNCLIGH